MFIGTLQPLTCCRDTQIDPDTARSVVERIKIPTKNMEYVVSNSLREAILKCL